MALKFKVGEVPRTKPFQFADLAELMVLVGLYSELSKPHLDQIIQSGSQDSDPDTYHGPPEAIVSEHDVYSKNAEDCLKHLRYRAGALDDDYPFVVENAVLTAKSKITSVGYLYLFLLVCSRLASFTGRAGFAQECAKTFTLLSKAALKSTLKDSAQVYVFDANSEDRKLLGTNLRDALRSLGRLLAAAPQNETIEQQPTSGDGGLDLIAVTRLDETAKGAIAYFGQCAAQQNGWPRKTLEPKRTGAFYHFAHQPYNLMFTPVMYRDGTGRWVNDATTQDCVVIDRLRLIRSLQGGKKTIPSPLWLSIRQTVDANPGTAN